MRARSRHVGQGTRFTRERTSGAREPPACLLATAVWCPAHRNCVSTVTASWLARKAWVSAASDCALARRMRWPGRAICSRTDTVVAAAQRCLLAGAAWWLVCTVCPPPDAAWWRSHEMPAGGSDAVAESQGLSGPVRRGGRGQRLFVGRRCVVVGGQRFVCVGGPGVVAAMARGVSWRAVCGGHRTVVVRGWTWQRLRGSGCSAPVTAWWLVRRARVSADSVWWWGRGCVSADSAWWWGRGCASADKAGW